MTALALGGNVRLGFEDDVKYCFTQDITDVVPVYDGGVIS